MKNKLGYERALILLTGALLFSIIVGLVMYSLFGHALVEAMYRSEIGMVDKIMARRAVIPLEDYYRAADGFVVSSAIRAGGLFFILLVLVVLVKKPIELLLACSSLFIFSFLLFCSFEVFPGLIGPLQLRNIPYYAYRESFLPDDRLGFREKPFIKRRIRTVFGGKYRSLLGVELAPVTINWGTDKEGFRNSRPMETADIVVIGDSFMEHGRSEADTFPRLLERHLDGLTVANLGKGGYGPFQYLEVLKKYGIGKKPKYAFFAFYEGNDLKDVERYLAWKEGREQESGWSYKDVYEMLTGSFLRRYAIVLSQAGDYIQDLFSISTRLAFKAFYFNRKHDDDFHRSIVALELDGGEYYTRFVDRPGRESADELVMTERWKALRNVLSEFQTECAENSIVPVILYIPMTAHIYAEYSTERSGKNWRRNREKQIAVMGNLREAMGRLSQELNMELIDLTPVFETAAKNGKMVYESLDSHWNVEGATIAAAFTAGTLRDKVMLSSERER